MIVRLVGIVGALILAGWLYWLTARVQLLLSHAESTLDRADRTLAAAMALVAAPPPVHALPSAIQEPQEERPEREPAELVPVSGLAPAGGPPTVPTGMVIEAEKRALVERSFSVHGAPRRFTFASSEDDPSAPGAG